MIRGMMAVVLIFMMGILVVPVILVTAFSSDSPGNNLEVTMQENEQQFGQTEMELEEGNNEDANRQDGMSIESVSVFRSNNEMIEEVPLEEYIIGVVASEMPASYEMEALKAQALTARTYLVRQMIDGNDLNLPEGADVTDTVMHQVYKNDDELKETWGNDYEWKISRVRKAALETEGQIITYEEEPITATFFSTSNGYTENSEEYWENEIPYLRSVESPWDKDSPRYEGDRQMTVNEFEQELGVQLADGEVGKIISRTTGGRVAKVEIGEQTFSGREIRDALELDSSDFDWERNGDNVVIQTRGWGHGVGMSQYGADSMAKSGKTYREIIDHYYHNVHIEEASSVLVNNEMLDGDQVSFANE
ncbi:stage II sporulation protein D [Salipaludibacillus daqingensis]|uniref:stage II sporulation protein D n=1 Tax=Salipaludibacillus daqingensis TaxID=3041001 RepID=UPI002474F7D0|nr:stage II sporulation protein D [Salipaludibacillus daqingensis]